MFRTKSYYNSITEAALNEVQLFNLTNRVLFMKLGVNLDEDIEYIKKEIRKRKLKRLKQLSDFREEMDEIISIRAPLEFQAMLLSCETKEQAKKVVGDIKRLHLLDPYWEENWFD